MITLATTLVDISTLDPQNDDWETASYTVAAASVRATVASPTGDHLRTVAADSVLIDALLDCDDFLAFGVSADTLNGALVYDSTDGQQYAIEWATRRTNALGLGHIHAGMLFRHGSAGN
jgi:hypothetical protein